MLYNSPRYGRFEWWLKLHALEKLPDDKVLVLGLDSTPPSIIYNELKDELPNLSMLMEETHTLRSSHPPITIPAWTVMLTGKTPGELGMYGFRHRKPGDYGSMYIVNSRDVKAPRIWDLYTKAGRSSIIVGVPPTYPPRPMKGYLITDFITPGPDKAYTWPPTLKREVEALIGGQYQFDVPFRVADKDAIIKGLWDMTKKQFKVFKHLLKTKRWDFAMIVQIGVDRVQHAFWKFYDPTHPRYPGEGNKYEDVIPNYYKLVDELVGEILEVIPKDTKVIVASDHGAKAMKGAFVMNQWLIEEGYLVLKKKPEKPGIDLHPEMVDWEKTKAWAWGGYYARVFLNIKGREPHGVIDPEEVPGFIEELKKKLMQVKGPNGESWNTKVYTPQELYPDVKGHPPDLIVYLDDLNWRSAGTLGWQSMYLEENDRGPDDAVHDWIGIVYYNWKPGIKDETIDINNAIIEALRKT
ncbi:MAG: alkaline phosphatase family protein [Desulfurococcales archaeon]|nr:alkaline phosphatase family protein [Desulfurococcales archaeon]